MRLNLKPHEAAGLARREITALCRVVKPQPYCPRALYSHGHITPMYGNKFDGMGYDIRSPFGQPGDVLAGCEAWLTTSGSNVVISRPLIGHSIHYKCDQRSAADSIDYSHYWRSAQTMPTWAVRTWLTVVSVRCCRVQDVTAIEAIRLGVQFASDEPKWSWVDQFDRDNGTGSYAANKWVWVAEVQNA